MKFQEYMANRLEGAERIVAIDIHTGLGGFGDDRLLVAAAPERAALSEEIRSVFGERVQLLDTRGVACEVRGAHYNLYYRLFPNAKAYFTAQEFGTYHSVRVVEALRAENRWHYYGGGGIDHPAKTRPREVFNPIDEGRRQRVLQRGHEVLQQGVALTLGQDAHLA